MSTQIRAQFPILSETVRGKPLVFLDSAASAQKPRAVIEAMVQAMEHQYANVHRGLHWMSERTTDAYEGTRDAVARLINATDRTEIVFVRNSTEAHQPRRAQLWPRHPQARSGGGDLRDGAPLQHRAMADAARRARHRAARRARSPMPASSTWRRSRRCWPTARWGWSSITHMSNVLGTYTPAERIAALAHDYGAKVMFDGSQAVVHRRVDVQALDADFYVFTGHKLYGPTGIGILWARKELLEAMPPFMGGGDMISSVTWERSTWAHVPHKFEAGTPAILEVDRTECGGRLRRGHRLRGDCRA